MSIAYVELISRLPLNERGEPSEAQRNEFDRNIGIEGWRTPLSVLHRPRSQAVVAVDAVGLKPPAWWRDDEDASQSFLASMGVKLDDG